MIERRCGARLEHEPLQAVRIARDVLTQDLERQITPKDGVLGEINLTHPAARDQAGNVEAPDGGVRQVLVGHRSRYLTGACVGQGHGLIRRYHVSMSKSFSAFVLTLAALLAFSFSTNAQAPPDSEEASRLRESITVLNEVMATSDTSIPSSIAAKAEGIAIFPGTLKAGFIFGGMRGRGVLSARTAGGWSLPTFMTLTGGSIGLQIGGRRPTSSSSS